jgi:hypothetical protein
MAAGQFDGLVDDDLERHFRAVKSSVAASRSTAVGLGHAPASSGRSASVKRRLVWLKPKSVMDGPPSAAWVLRRGASAPPPARGVLTSRHGRTAP